MINIANDSTSPCRMEPASSGLTSRETQVLDLLVKGFSNQQIADSLGVSFYTATSHLKNIYKKLGVHKRTEAVVKVLAGSFSNHRLNPAQHHLSCRHPENLQPSMS